MGPDREAEFRALSAKVSEKTATEEERVRWRALRAELAASRPPPPPPPGLTLRAHPRATRKLRVQFAAVSELMVSFTDEVGGGGLRLRAQKHLEPGTELVVRLDVAEGQPVHAGARVVWSRREGGHFAIGVELVDLTPADAERLEALTHAKP